MNQWKRLDPSEILVHNLKYHDQVDDMIEAAMRKNFKTQFLRRGEKTAKEKGLQIEAEKMKKHVEDFVDCLPIEQLQKHSQKYNIEEWQDLCDSKSEVDSEATSTFGITSEEETLGQKRKPDTLTHQLGKLLGIPELEKRHKSAFEDKYN